MKITASTFGAAKGNGKLTMLTAYDFTTAKIMDNAGIDALLVGDSLGMVMLGYPDTVSVTMDDMIHHCRPVARAAKHSLVICDMPYMSYHSSVPSAVKNAGRLVSEGRAQAVKLEGGMDFAAEIRAIVRASIPVMGHIGLTPQSVNALGGFKVQGKSAAAAQKLLDDARAVQDAGAFAIVIECVPADLASLITKDLEIPVIGIGAGRDCDGQVLVWQDMLGMVDSVSPRFVRHFAELGQAMATACADYRKAVADGSFPAPEHCYAMEDSGCLARLV